MNKYKSHIIAILVVVLILFSQVSYFWENNAHFAAIDNFFDYLFLMLHGVVILILTAEGRQRKAAYILILIEIVFLISSIFYLL